MKKIALLLVSLLLCGFLFANGSGETASAAVPAPAKVLPAVTGPVTIQIWHTRGAGPNGDMIAASVKEFNASNKLGITVEEVYQGNYATALSKIQAAVAAGTNPALCVLERAAGVPVMVTGTGRFFRNTAIDPEHSFGIIRMDENGANYQILWGLVDGKPTSELPTHLLNHASGNARCLV